MAKCTYFFDKVTNKIIASHSHAERAEDGSIVPADSDLSDVWEDIRTGTMWSHILEKVTDQDPDNMGFIVAEEMPHGYNEYLPSKLSSTEKLKRRSYFQLAIADGQDVVKKSKEHDTHRFYDVDTTGNVTLRMEVRVKTTQDTIEKHDIDNPVKGVNGDFIVECTAGRIIPRNGKIKMVNSAASFEWYLPDSTSNQVAKCFVKDPNGEILISKSLRVNCC
ncbi:MAG: hypothetical protein COV46_03535 [Deltaproteobacteria bacterium CG11_big_fil_rev_8_21_14_0_20_49_13]|nr:MAG: hypothetical protein COV46_03535 [Deltaproteobacteria bacterium CG11_big_fil_rev_8_21_14_0_20_49_13]